MKTPEDEAFDELERRQGGFQAKRAMAADKLQEPAQEPVAWAVYDILHGGSKTLHWPEQHSPNGDPKQYKAVPLYTAPPQRTWVGLTDEERDDLLDTYITAEGRARAIEQYLKEKNT